MNATLSDDCALSTSYRGLSFTRRIATVSTSLMYRLTIQRQCTANNAYIRRFDYSWKKVLPRSPRRKIVFIESSTISRLTLDCWNEESGKRSLTNYQNKKWENEKKMKKYVREEEDNERGNGKWHDDDMRSEGSYTFLFLYSCATLSSFEDDVYEDWIKQTSQNVTH